MTLTCARAFFLTALRQGDTPHRRMKRQRELGVIQSYDHGRALRGDANNWVDLLPFKRWSTENEIPCDVVQLIVCQCLIPVCDRIDKEVSVIARMRMYIPHVLNTLNEKKIIRMYEAVLKKRVQVLERGVVDSDLNPYLNILTHMVNQKVITCDEILHVLQQGITEDKLLALKALNNANMLDRFPSAIIDSLIQRSTQKYSAKPTWQPSDIDDMTTLIEYYLDTKEEEPLMEWLTVWVRKGLDICKSAMYTIHRETRKEQMALLRAKQLSPEMKKRRLNVLIHNVYSDEDICK